MRQVAPHCACKAEQRGGRCRESSLTLISRSAGTSTPSRSRTSRIFFTATVRPVCLVAKWGGGVRDASRWLPPYLYP